MTNDEARAKMRADLIFVWYISKNTLFIDGNFPRSAAGLLQAKAVVKEYEDKGLESFYTIGTGADQGQFEF